MHVYQCDGILGHVNASRGFAFKLSQHAVISRRCIRSAADYLRTRRRSPVSTWLPELDM